MTVSAINFQLICHNVLQYGESSLFVEKISLCIIPCQSCGADSFMFESRTGTLMNLVKCTVIQYYSNARNANPVNVLRFVILILSCNV